jgi:signal transduction histidine kinase
MSVDRTPAASQDADALVARLGADKTEALARLASGVAHELRNPLAVILARVQLLRMGLKGGQPPDLVKLDRALRTIEEQALRASKTIESLSLFARPRAPQAVPLDITRTIRQAIDKLQAAGRIEEGTRIEVDAAPGLPSLVADPEQLAAAIAELIENAIEAMPSGGTVKVTVGHSGDSMEVAVADRGAGVEPHDAERIFDPFFTTKPGAAGLGLCVAHTIAGAHRGSVSLATSGPAGSTFVLTLPLQGPGRRA